MQLQQFRNIGRQARQGNTMARQVYILQTDLPPVSAAVLACSVQRLAARVAQLPQSLWYILQSAAAGDSQLRLYLAWVP